MDLPSWVPDWSYYTINNWSEGPDYNATKKRKALVRKVTAYGVSDRKALAVSGNIIDTIQYLSKEKAHLLDNDGVYEGGVTSKVQYLWYLEVKDLVEQHIPEQYATGQSREEVLWRTVIGDVGLENVRPARKEYGDYHKVWMRILADVDNFIACCKRNELPPGYKSD